jgi:peptide/nickel transport system substrate-binding protein/oligopeptide transport system substrate-binding protein
MLNLALAEDIRTLDPALGFDTYSTAFIHALAAGLLDYDEGLELMPDLAERWEVSEDGRTYTFFLRPGLKFSDGSPLTAADFKYALERVLRPATASPGAQFYTVIQGAPAFRGGKATSVSGIETPDPQTVRITLERPSPTFLNVMAMTFTAPVPRAAVERLGADFARQPVGAGPFRVRSYTPGQRLQLERNPSFYRSNRPYLDAVDVQIRVEERVQVLRFENGQLDVLHYIPAADYPRFKTDPKWGPLLVEGLVNTVWFLGMNTRMKPFDNRRVRQAVAHAVDPARVVRLINGRGQPLTGLLPPKLPGYDPTIKGYAHDAARARVLLAEAGYPSGFATTLWTASGDRYLKVAQGVQADLKAVGIAAQLKPAEMGQYLEAIHAPDTTPIFYAGWYPDFPDPGNFLEPLFHSRNISSEYSTNSSFLSAPEVDRLLDQGASMPAGEERLEVYRKAQAAIMEEAPWAPLYVEIESRLRQPTVGGLTIHPVWPYLRLAELWKSGAGER